MYRRAIFGLVVGLGVVVTLAPAGAAPTAGPTVASAPAHRAPRSPAAPAARANVATAALTVTVSSGCAAFCFVPAQMRVAVGDTVTWVNRSGTEHDVTRCSPAACNGASAGTGTDPSFKTGNLAAAAGATFSHTFTAPGTYVYFCTIHGYALMHGTITVAAPPPPTTAAPPVSLPPTSAAAPVTAPAPGTSIPPAPRLANTGAASSDITTLALLLVVSGLAATGLARRRRHSTPAR